MNYRKLFVGNDREQSCFDGNTLLLKIAPLTYYIVAGPRSKFFTTFEEVIEFHSPMGNSPVLLPYAVSNNYVYLPIDGDGGVYTEGPIYFSDPQRVYDIIEKINPRHTYTVCAVDNQRVDVGIDGIVKTVSNSTCSIQ